MQRLVDTGLLVEFDPAADSMIEFLRSHRLFPTGEGLGNTRESPEYFRIGRDGNVLFHVLSEVYTLWGLSHNNKSMWDSVGEFFRGLDQDPVIPYDRAGLGSIFAAAIPLLVAGRCAYLQPL